MMIKVMTPGRKRGGVEYPPTATEYTVVIVVGRSIKIYCQRKDLSMVAGSAFEIGDAAEYGSYNLSYTGEITKITDKAVTIKKYGTSHRLNLYEFCWRNRNFNAADTAARNAETSMYI